MSENALKIVHFNAWRKPAKKLAKHANQSDYSNAVKSGCYSIYIHPSLADCQSIQMQLHLINQRRWNKCHKFAMEFFKQIVNCVVAVMKKKNDSKLPISISMYTISVSFAPHNIAYNLNSNAYLICAFTWDVCKLCKYLYAALQLTLGGEALNVATFFISISLELDKNVTNAKNVPDPNQCVKIMRSILVCRVICRC